jgi:GNAT superfamily N-acetyltransferase
MRVVRTSEIFKILSIPSLGKYTNGLKLRTGSEPYFVKERGKYICKDKEMDYAMVLEYVDKDWVIQLSNSEDYNNIYLAAIFVKNKGKGIGTDLMNKILDYCDENGYKLFLHPFPLEYTKSNFNPKKALPLFYKLKDWYKSFDMVEQEDGYMVYYPQNQK